MISKDGFVMLMDAMRDQRDFDRDSAESLARVFGPMIYYNNDAIVAGVLSFLQHEFDDKDGWIEVFAYALDYGRAEFCTVLHDGREVNLSSSEDLWGILQN